MNLIDWQHVLLGGLIIGGALICLGIVFLSIAFR